MLVSESRPCCRVAYSSWREREREDHCEVLGRSGAGVDPLRSRWAGCGPPEVGAGPVSVRAVCCPGGRRGDGRGDDELGTRTQREKMESERAEAAA